ncbi:DUF4352 domain-containing protein [Streptomyces sp. MS06]|uniref:DUF4352 domain-containing protein n=1 Tax=Streptomyces sp. MS06 TaxID=3385974 RepID=UPI0039A2F3CB
MRIRTAAIATAIALGTTLTACSSGDTISSTPVSSAAGTPASDTSSAPPKTPEAAKVGDTISVKGGDDGSKLDVTVVKIADPAKPADEFTEPGSGKRFVGVQFRLVNTGTAVYSDSPGNGTQVADSQGQRFGETLADISAGPSMSSDVKLKPGAKALGWVVFEVPKASKVATVQFTMDSGFAEQTAEWKLS